MKMADWQALQRKTANLSVLTGLVGMPDLNKVPAARTGGTAEAAEITFVKALQDSMRWRLRDTPERLPFNNQNDHPRFLTAIDKAKANARYAVEEEDEE